MPNYPVVLVHGYSDAGRSFAAWGERLRAAGHDVREVRVGNWRSLANEVSLEDVAEGFQRALEEKGGLAPGARFSAIVHSTGTLVLRAWLAADPARRTRLQHLIGLAPANWGSPLAHKGRSFLGMLAKGNRDFGEDFLEVGDRVLDALELGSRFTWDLAHRDLLGAHAWYANGSEAPWAYVICGTGAYGWPRRMFADPPGSDGVVRWCGSALDVRKLTIDLSRRALAPVTVQGERLRDVPLAFVPDRHHGAVLSKPTGDLARMVLDALAVRDADADAAWRDRWVGAHRPTEAWQQFVVRLRDERGQGIADYNVQLEATYGSGARETLVDFASDVHPYRRDPSYRAFHVRLRDVKRTRITSLRLKVLARTNTTHVGYRGGGGDAVDGWDGALDLSRFGPQGEVKLFWPFTTTLVEVVLDREPRPYTGPNEVFWFAR